MEQRISISLILIFAAAIASADVITSAPGGGLWEEADSWIGGQVPGAYDDVLIASSIQVRNTAECLGLSVLSTGILAGDNTSYATLIAGASASNEGVIRDGIVYFTLMVGGDLNNTGDWINRDTILTGSESRSIISAPGALLATNIELDETAEGDVIVSEALRIEGGIDLNGGRMVVEPGNSLTLYNCAFTQGDLLCNNNDVIIEGWSYFSWTVLDQAVLLGEVEISTATSFTGGLTVMDTLQNSSGSAGTIPISGGLVNKGLITNHGGYGWSITLSGDLRNDGIINNSGVFLDGQSEHHLSGGSEGLFDTFVFLPEFQGGTIVADTDLHFSDGLGFGGGEMILAPGSKLSFTGWGSMGSGTVYANGNEIHMDGYGSTLGDMVIDEAVLSGRVRVLSPMEFTGGLTVRGIFENREYHDHEISVEGLLLNEGEIKNEIHELTIHLLGDLENRGLMSCAQVLVEGYYDQRIGVGDGIEVPVFQLESWLTQGPFQWFRNGLPLDGQTESTLSFSALGADDYGVYHCEGVGGALSRNIFIDEYADPTDVPPSAVEASLERNFPNPFNPATSISFTLPSSGHARLAVYDTAGRQVDLLIDAQMESGRHTITWKPQSSASGLYFYKLRFANQEFVGKCTLLK